jgi:hypothetical protein
LSYANYQLWVCHWLVNYREPRCVRICTAFSTHFIVLLYLHFLHN